MREALLPFFLLPVGFVALGVLFAIIGFRPRRTDEAFLRIAKRAPGVVVDLRWRGHGLLPGGRIRVAYPVVRFATADGAPVEVELSQGRSPPPGRKGQAVTVLYDPADPGRALVEEFIGQGRVIRGCIGALGVLFALAGLGTGAALLLLATVG